MPLNIIYNYVSKYIEAHNNKSFFFITYGLKIFCESKYGEKKLLFKVNMPLNIIYN